jgi:ribulose-5-phosphate 4-epimerase/fuculose-1-phosphate aldolase
VIPQSFQQANEETINPYGLMFDEITASSLLKVDHNCNKLSDSPFFVNPAGFTIHSAVHAAREDAGCVLHTHTRAGVAVSAQKHGVLPMSQQSTFVLASLAYHEYEGVAFREEEKPRLQGVAQAMKVQTGGMGGAFVWPALIRKIDRTDQSYKT